MRQNQHRLLFLLFGVVAMVLFFDCGGPLKTGPIAPTTDDGGNTGGTVDDGQTADDDGEVLSIPLADDLLQSTGGPGGPFEPASVVVTVKNKHAKKALKWSVTHSETWLTISKTSGMLGVEGSETVEFFFNDAAKKLPVGSYTDTLEFTQEIGKGRKFVRYVKLNVSQGGTSAICGDNKKEAPEVCDGSDLAGQTCQSQGFVGGSLTCEGDCTAFDMSGCVNQICGNHKKEGTEVCDGTDLMGKTCQSEGFLGGTLRCDNDCGGFNTSSCLTQICGNNHKEGTEVCDGNDLGGQSCQGQGFPGGSLKCNNVCTAFDTSSCATEVCGNNKKEGTEVCDGSDLAGRSCQSLGFAGGVLTCKNNCKSFDTKDCTSPPTQICGNNVREGTEVCDGVDLVGQTCQSQGFAGGTLRCANVCTAFDTSSCVTQLCGNNKKEGTEVCDGSDLAGRTCQSQGFAGGTLKCANACTAFDTSSCLVQICGNDKKEGTEACDGSDLAGRTCQSQGFAGGVLKCNNACTAFDTGACVSQICGNNKKEGTEACDGSDLAGQTCESMGFTGGALSCNGSCTGFDTASCTNPPPACSGSTTVFQNFAIPAQTGSFVAEFNARPSVVGMDGEIGLSLAAGTGYADFAVLVRFSNRTRIDARNGGAYAADRVITYNAGKNYHFRLLINVATHTYTIYVRSVGGSEQLLGTDYDFRREQSAVTSLGNWGFIAEAGSVQVCNFTIHARSPSE